MKFWCKLDADNFFGWNNKTLSITVTLKYYCARAVVLAEWRKISRDDIIITCFGLFFFQWLTHWSLDWEVLIYCQTFRSSMKRNVWESWNFFFLIFFLIRMSVTHSCEITLMFQLHALFFSVPVHGPGSLCLLFFEAMFFTYIKTKAQLIKWVLI